nr:putative late blight resistance protein homolog R1B-14 [Ipomoea trifida]
MEAAVSVVAEAVVNVLAETLTGLLSENFQLISGVDDDVQKLLRSVNGFKSILKEYRKIRTENEIVKQLVKDIMDVVYRSENLIDQYVVDANIHAEKKLTNFVDFGKKKEVAKNIKTILDEIKVIQERTEYQKVIENSVLPREHAPSVQQKAPKVEEEYVVGFDGEAKTIIQRLRDESSYEVISVLGMAGLGKTTLANKVFKSQEIEYHFMHRVWIYVSQLYKKKDVYLQILKKLQQSNDTDTRVTEEELALKIKQVLGLGKYLIVLDDVWTKEAFEDILHDAFPERAGCKVLVTTRKDEVAMMVNSLGEPHRLKFLEPGESWELLEKKQQGSSCRRLSVHRPFENFISSKVQKPELRSLLCFAASNGVQIPANTIISLRKAFPLLRVLHFAPDDSVTFTTCHKDIFRLFHLRYIAISTTVQILPKEIANLQNVQTLIVRTTRPTLEIKGDIWNMPRLRHFQTNASAKLPSLSASKTKRAPFANENLQTLSKVSPFSCTPAALAKASNIKKLGIRGTLAKLLEIDPTSGSSLFKNLGKLKKLVNLKLINDGEKLQRLPQKYEFPENLRKLTLSKTSLQWKELTVLGTLETLEILKLIERAAEGEYWEPTIGGFLYLQVLHIDRTDLRSWNASNKNFPRLRSLVLSHCEQLEEIPHALADISSLQEIELKHTKKAIKSAQDILKQKQNPTEKSNRRFKLTIYPPLPLDPSQAI